VPSRPLAEHNGPANSQVPFWVGLSVIAVLPPADVVMLGLLLALGIVLCVSSFQTRGFHLRRQAVTRDLSEWLHVLGPTSFAMFAAQWPRDPRQRARGGGGRSGSAAPISKPPRRAPTGRITVMGPGQPAEDFPVAVRQAIIVGRGTAADIVVDDPQVSRRHLEIQLTPRNWLVRDLGATNPAEVDRGAEYRPVHGEETLAHGRLRVGSSLLILHPIDPTKVALGSTPKRRTMAIVGIAIVGIVAVVGAVVLAAQRPDEPRGEILASAEIGPDGGAIETPDGSLRLIVPPGALTSTTTAQLATANLPAEPVLGSVVGNATDVNIQKQYVQAPLTIEIPIPADFASDPGRQLYIAHYDSELGTWEALASELLMERGLVVAQSMTFSPTVLVAGPRLRMPYDRSRTDIRYTGGPHDYNPKPYCSATISSSSGIDFAALGSITARQFEVLSIAPGKVKASNFTVNGNGPGFFVIIDHGEFQSEYWHLDRQSDELRQLVSTHGPNPTVPGGFPIAFAGQTGGQADIHLHLELSINRSRPGPGGQSWNGQPIDGWVIYQHAISDKTGYNYQGTAIRGPRYEQEISIKNPGPNGCDIGIDKKAIAQVAMGFSETAEVQPTSGCVQSSSPTTKCTVFAAIGTDGVHLPSTNATCTKLDGCDNRGEAGPSDPDMSLYTVSGLVHSDTNRNMIQDRGEPGLPDVRLSIEGPLSATTITGNDGSYSFLVPAGQYTVKLQVPGGFTPVGVTSTTVAAGPARSTSAVNFSLVGPEPPTPPPKLPAAPGGVWVTVPAENTVVTSSQINLEARAYPSAPASPAVSRVNFTMYSAGEWRVICESSRPTRADIYACTVDLRNVPPGEFRISFDVYDQSGKYQLAPNGVRTLRKGSEVAKNAAPSAPTQASVQAVDQRAVKVAWTPGSTNHTGFRVYGTAGTLLATVGDAARSANIGGFAPNERVCVNVAAFNSVGESAVTYAGCVTTLGSAPLAPSQASIKAIDANTVQVSWAPGSADQTGFRIYGTGGTLLASAGASARSINIAGFQPDTQVCVNVLAFNSIGESSATYAGCATTLPPTYAFTATLEGYTPGSISWNSNGDLTLCYRLSPENVPFTLDVTRASDDLRVAGANDNGIGGGDCIDISAAIREMFPSTCTAEILVGAFVNGAYRGGRPRFTINKTHCAPSQQYKINVPANANWTSTGIPVRAGQTVTIIASGTIKIAGSDPGKGPDGGGGSSCGVPGAISTLACYSLIGKIDAGVPFAVGASYSGTPGSGILYLGVNDDVFSDNSGSWSVQVVVQ